MNENQCTGTGPNKKLAKRAAAEVMLQTMGYSKPSPQPDKPAIRTPGTTPTAETANKKVQLNFYKKGLTKLFGAVRAVHT